MRVTHDFFLVPGSRLTFPMILIRPDPDPKHCIYLSFLSQSLSLPIYLGCELQVVLRLPTKRTWSTFARTFPRRASKQTPAVGTPQVRPHPLTVVASSQCYWEELMLLKCQINKNTNKNGFLLPTKCLEGVLKHSY